MAKHALPDGAPPIGTIFYGGHWCGQPCLNVQTPWGPAVSLRLLPKATR